MSITARGYRDNTAPKEEELMAMQAGARVKGVLPEITDTVEKAKRSVVTKAEMAVADGTLTPERALSFWQEHFAYSKVLRDMETKARLGEAAGKRLEETLSR